VDRIRRASELLSEDVALMRVGKLKVMSHGFEVTEEHRQRLEKVLNQLEAFERENGEVFS
jgi:hypothetical protein